MRVLAIPPFEDNSQDREVEWLARGFADMLATDLAATKRVNVVARMHLEKVLAEQKQSLSDLTDPARRLRLGAMVGANSVLVGTFLKIGDTLRVDAQVYDTETGESIAAASAQDSVSAVFSIEKMLALRLLTALGVELPPSELVELMQIRSPSVDATKLYLQAQEHVFRGENNDAKTLLDRAMEIDPYFRVAAKERDKTRIAASGVALFAQARDDLHRKQAQTELVKQVLRDIHTNLVSAELVGITDVATDSTDPSKSTVLISVRFALDETTLVQALDTLHKASAGTVTTSFDFLGRSTRDYTLFTETINITVPSQNARGYLDLFLEDSDGRTLASRRVSVAQDFRHTRGVERIIYSLLRTRIGDIELFDTRGPCAPVIRERMAVDIDTHLLERVHSARVELAVSNSGL